MMSEYVQITTTTDSKELAQKIAETLVEKKLAACAQISGPITSIYEWKGKVENEEEWYCVIKTRKNLYQEVEENIKALHPYEVPEIIALPIVEGNKAYLAWINEVVKD
ncbi:MAG: divalent cation tolerance protein CutA [Candidatus Aminicenantes bacterium]|nr:divalent cation tolerance protein CutA [Candidatus Aminicenantes bacterium]NIM83911.1 divalent cation tolerance protein CutA [Candidatus Aminicenantes bacterium]NIN23377.1 divalent cation tolerance protein CutA [Candidatus Aminicenantes bacterium]NIN47079.1 divalent cation tolerance protein CutA [Candidatus Aminicenantes bacterium]NIN90003.1 divalent cation tolerance protein CutA [Candidatus Aminicenantes bacterium]